MNNTVGFSRNQMMRPAAPEKFWWPYIAEDERPKSKGTAHLHWTVTAFAAWGGPDGDQMMDALPVEVEAADEQGAIARAQALITRPCYRVSAVREACSIDKDIRETGG